MVRYRYAAAMALVLIVFTSAVAVAAREMTFGAKAGIIMSNLTETPESWDDAKSYKAGFTGGIFMNYAFNGIFSIEPEMLYTMKGVKGNLYDGIVSVDVAADLDYFELPLLGVFTLRDGKKLKPRVYAGPSFAYTLGSTLDISVWLANASVDISSLTHKTDFGVVAGAGFDYTLGKGTLTFDVRYQRGFTNVIMTGDLYINGSRQTISGDDFKNYGFAFMVGYGI
jgi:hypothetical protein